MCIADPVHLQFQHPCMLGVLPLLLRKGLDDTREVLGPKRSVQKSFLIMLEKCAL